MTKTQSQRKALRIIEVDRRGNTVPRWKRWLKRTFKAIVQVAALYAFVRTWGLRALVIVAAFAATAGAAVVAE